MNELMATSTGNLQSKPGALSSNIALNHEGNDDSKLLCRKDDVLVFMSIVLFNKAIIARSRG